MSFAQRFVSVLCQFRNSQELANFAGETARAAMGTIVDQREGKARIEHTPSSQRDKFYRRSHRRSASGQSHLNLDGKICYEGHPLLFSAVFSELGSNQVVSRVLAQLDAIALTSNMYSNWTDSKFDK